MPLRTAGKRQVMPLAVEPKHRQQTKATWKKCNLSLKAPTVFHEWQFIQNPESLQHVFTVPSPTAWGKENFVRSGFHTCSSIIKNPWVYFLPAPICSFGNMNTVQSSIASKRLRVHSRHQPPLEWSDRMLNGMPKIAQRRHGAPKIMHIIFFCRNGILFDYPVSNGVTLSGQS